MLEGETVVDLDGSRYLAVLLQNSCKLATTLTLILACLYEPGSMFDAPKSQSRSRGGLPNMAEIIYTPSANLPKRLLKLAAIDDGRGGKTTVLGVNLIDVEMIEQVEAQSEEEQCLLRIFLDVVLSREGFRVYHSRGGHGYRGHGYRLHQSPAWGGSRLRCQNKTKSFLKPFQKLYCSSVR